MTHSSDLVYADSSLYNTWLCFLILFSSFYLAGRLCTVTVNMCACEPETCTLLRYGLWPATPDKPQTAFSIPLLELFVCLSLECQVSVEGFCNTLRWKNNLTLAEVSQFAEVSLKSCLWSDHFSYFHGRLMSPYRRENYTFVLDCTTSLIITTKSKHLWNHLGLYSCMQKYSLYFSIK